MSNLYIDMMNKRMDSLDKETVRKVKEPLSKYLADSVKNTTNYANDAASNVASKVRRDD